MPLLILYWVLPIACGIHVVRTGRPLFWLWIIIFAPMIGCAIYVIVEVIPELMGSPRAQRAAGRAKRIVDPNRAYRAALDRLEAADTVDNRRAVAEHYLERGMNDEAAKLYASTLTGVHQDDPALLFGLARAEFAAGRAAEALQALDQLKAANPGYQSPDAHLIYARALEALGRDAEAREEYEALAGYYPGAEARCRYALLLKKMGEGEKARALFAEIVKSLDRAGRRFIREQREWYDLARQNMG